MANIAFLDAILFLSALLVLAGIFSSLIASRFGAPLLLVFLVVGMLAGEDGPGGLVFNNYGLTYLGGSFALAIILFDGGLRTRLARFRGVLAPSILLATVGVVVTAAVVGAAAMVALDIGALEGMLVGAIVAPTDAAAVFFLLRTGGLQLRPRVGSTLEIESGTNDPVAVFLVIVLVELIAAGGEPGWGVVAHLAAHGLLGALLGIGGGLAITAVLNRVDLPGGLHPLMVVSGAVLIYAMTSVAGGSGFLAVYLAGLVVGNRPVRAFASIVSFHDTATWLCQIIMFLMLGLLVTPSRLVDFTAPALGIAFALILVARPAAAFLCLAPFRFSLPEQAFIAWVGLRGAVSIFLAAIPMLSQLPAADHYFNIAFFVVLVSLLVQGWSINFAARRLRLALPTTLAKVHRVELDLPGQLAQEIVGYPILADTAVMDHGALPDWVRPVMVVRREAILSAVEAGPLEPGDYAYFLAPPDRIHRLDRLFAAPGEGAADRRALIGEFSFNGDVPLRRLAELYGIALAEDEAGLTIAEVFAQRFEGKPIAGDRLPVGAMTLVARALDGDRVVKAGLQLGELPGAAIGTLLRTGGLVPLRAMAARLLGQLR
jgi:cell volume regulation protein A